MKPIHEQTWTYRGLSGCVTDEDGNDVSSPDAPDEALRFIAQAPKMAARLREIHRVPSNNNGEVVISGEFVDLIGDLLREAGVPL